MLLDRNWITGGIKPMDLSRKCDPKIPLPSKYQHHQENPSVEPSKQGALEGFGA
jgi:hypothetical protein